ncbi:fructose-bisphosphate aldolase class I [Ectothiorhodospiraceae bacterium WFHF3C12]|nr:fructose-bisphosphate aldolase class I [Ectothiorhodospiraceae bacterium WFHF3C12]
MVDSQRLAETVQRLTAPGRGILAADESTPTITKRFDAVGIESTEENRRAYRSLLVTTPGIGEYIGGVIFFEETLDQRTDGGETIPEAADKASIVPGIKVDKGTIELTNAPGDKITQGLDNLGERLKGYREKGARFTKWRNVYAIGHHNPTPLAIEANAEVLARYAAIAQEQGFVPIVEPEVLMDGDHDAERCAQVTEAVQHAVFAALIRHRVSLEYMILKPNMVVPGKSHPMPSAEEVAERTLTVLRRTVPAAVPSINFLSGGQSPEQATANLNAMAAASGGQAPWVLSFSYARALQQPPMEIWAGQSDRADEAQKAFHHRARLNAAARAGAYSPDMEAA